MKDVSLAVIGIQKDRQWDTSVYPQVGETTVLSAAMNAEAT